jgi:hypothetical protein
MPDLATRNPLTGDARKVDLRWQVLGADPGDHDPAG